MLPGRCRQSATLSCQSPVHARNVLLGPGHRLRRSGYLLPQGLALRLRLLGSLEQIGTVGVRVGHNRTSIPLSPLLPAPHQIAPELVSITLLPLQGAAAPTTPATASPRLRPRRPHRRGLQRSPAPDHRRPDERIGAEAPDRQQAQGRRWPPPVPATAHPGRPGGSGTGDRPRAPPARPSPEPFLGRVQRARQDRSGSSCLPWVELESPVRALAERLLERGAAHEAQYLRRLGGELPVGISAQVQPAGDTATGELVVPGGGELAGG